MSEHTREEEKPYPVGQSAAFAGSTFVTMGLVDLLAHLGPTGLLVGGLASYVAWKHGPEVYEHLRDLLPPPMASEEEQVASEEASAPRASRTGGRSLVDRALGRFPDPVAEVGEEKPSGEANRERQPTPQRPQPTEARGEEIAFDLDGEEDMSRPSMQESTFLFSDVLERFDPTLERIFLARTEAGQDLSCTARDLCHVALAGSTGGGKSSIMRMLMLQLCQVGVRVLLLNPHYTRYDLDNDEDWTPFEPYLVHPPMECRDYAVIEHYLKSTAKELIPKRLERRAHSQPVGKPYFLVIDELPSIVREIKAAPDYIRVILEEGRKVGVFLISAAQDFLVRTIAPKAGGGSIRECYRTAYYVGGDATTAHVLLDMPASLIQEDALGRGVAMLRSVPTKRATQVVVPYVENAALYRLLGPSTYQASRSADLPPVDFPCSRAASRTAVRNDHAEPSRASRTEQEGPSSSMRPTPLREQTAHLPWSQPVVSPSKTTSEEERQQSPAAQAAPRLDLEKYRRPLQAWHTGNQSVRSLAQALGESERQAYTIMQEMHNLGLIEMKKRG